jgi:hypothetical protein
MTMANDPSSIRRLQDQFAIRDVLARYARGVDRRDWNLIRAAFHMDAWDDHGSYRGNVDGLIEWVSRRHNLIDQAMHFLGNCLVEFADEDTALVETYYSAYLRLGPAAEESRSMLLGSVPGDAHIDTTVLGRYIDRFERRNGEWRIAKRISVYEAIRNEPVLDPSRNPEYDWAQRDDSDALYTMRANVFGTKGSNES